MRRYRLLFCLLLLSLTQPSPAQIITTYAGMAGPPYGVSGDGGPALNAHLGSMYHSSVAFDAAGNMYIPESGNNTIRKVDATGIITTIAGTGTIGYTGDGGPALSATLYHPGPIIVDNAGNIIFADQNEEVLRQIDAAGNITTVSAAFTGGCSGEGVPLSQAVFVGVVGLAKDNAGNIYVSDQDCNTVRKISTTRIVTTVAGNGTLGFSGDGGPATAAQLDYPCQVGIDNAGNIYIPDAGNNRIRKVNTSGIITTIGGDGVRNSSGDGGPAALAEFALPESICVDNAGNIYVAENASYEVRKIDPSGIVTDYAGNRTYGYSGDGGPASQAQVTEIENIDQDAGGNIYVVDYYNQVIRKVTNCPLTQVALQPSDNSLCVGANAVFAFTASGSTGLQWQANSGTGWNDINDGGPYTGTTTNSLTITSPPAALSGTQYRCALLNGCGTITTVPATLTVAAPSTPALTIATASTSICTGASATFTATPANGGAGPSFQWQLNGTNTGANSPLYSNSALNNGDVLTCTLTTSAACATAPTAASNAITMTVNPRLTPGINITGPTTAICAGTSATFTATATNAGPAPTYQWQINGNPVGTNSPTYSNPGSLNNGDAVTCLLTSNAACTLNSESASNPVLMKVDPVVTPDIGIATATPSVCAGTSVTFTAAAVNGGASPAFQWSVNGLPVGSSAPSYVTNTLQNGDDIGCIMTSAATCPTTPSVSSNTITEQVKPVVNASVSIDASATTICSGTPVSFTATPVNGGASPAYQWQLNGNNTGSNKPTFASSGLSNGDVIACTMTGSLDCSTPAAAPVPIVMTVNTTPTITPMPDTIIALGQSLILSSTVTGPVTAYQWSPTDGLDNPAAPAPVAFPLNTTTYHVTVTTDAGCTANGSVKIGVFKTLRMPAAFSPNGDGKNDLFRIPPSLSVKISAFAVFDRYGARVFYTSDGTAGWDGTLDGHPQPAGAYVWMIVYEDLLTHKSTHTTGTVILIR